MDNALYLFSAYSIVWAVIFLYTVGLSRRQKSMERQMAEMKEALRKNCQGTGPESGTYPFGKP